MHRLPAVLPAGIFVAVVAATPLAGVGAGPIDRLAVIAARHPDTADTRGPYRVSFRPIAAPEISGGRVEFAVTDDDGAPRAAGQAVVRRSRDGRSWEADLPGQPAGSTIAYHAMFTVRAGEELRHPARAPAAYRFRVVALRPVSLSLPEPDDLERGRAPVKLLVEATSPPSGSAVVRLPGGASADERRIDLSVRRRGAAGAAASLFEMKGELPPPPPGGIVDFYIEARLPSQEIVRIPADAPARVLTVKHAMRTVRPVPPGRPFVLDVAAVGPQRWIGLQGGGARVIGPGGGVRRLGPGAGMIGAVARFILPDPAAGLIYLGTDSGAVGVGAAGESWMPIGPPRRSAWAIGSPAVPAGGWRQRAGPGALSTLDGTLLFQVQGEDAGREAPGPAHMVRLRDGRVSVTPLPAPEMPLVGLSFADFDAVDGCWLIAGYMRQGSRGLRPAVIESCDGTARPMALRDPAGPGEGRSVERVVALARDPATGGLVAAVETLAAAGPPTAAAPLAPAAPPAPAEPLAPAAGPTEPRPGYAVLRLDLATGSLTSLDPALDRLDVEVTALAADRVRGRLLIGTLGRGLLTLPPAGPGALAADDGLLPAGVTALRVDDASGAILIGTVEGAFEIPAGGGRPIPIGPRGDGPLLADALPMDVDRSTGRVLLSSHVEGLVQLAPASGGRWEIAAHLRPGRELPEGFYGDARYATDGRLIAILRTRGLLVHDGTTPRVLGVDEGLTGTLLLRVLARRNGDIWVAHSPLPFGTDAGATLQMIHDGRVERTVPIAGRDLATIARWVEPPVGASVLAATRAGVIAIAPDGTFEPLSRHAAASIALDPRTGTIGVVGSQVERRDGEGHFTPILFAIDHPRWPSGRSPAGSPIDLAIARDGTWFLLYPDGLVALLHPERGFLGLLDPEDGIPSSAHRLLAHPGTGEVFVGSDGEGVVVLGPPGRVIDFPMRRP